MGGDCDEIERLRLMIGGGAEESGEDGGEGESGSDGT